jgi:uncharacterized spore protein YtfJ
VDVQQVLTGAQDILMTRRVFGDPVRVDDATIIPVAVVRGGGGGGSRSAEGGVGFGVNARPAGVYVVRSGEATWRPAVDVNRIVLGGQIVGIVALLTLRPLLTLWLNRQSRRSSSEAPRDPSART